jgi:hypothetical protein
MVYAGLLLLSSCAKVGDRSQLKDVLPHQPGAVEPLLGDGYDSLVQEVRNTPSCVSGETTKLSSGASSIDIGQNVDSERLMREFSGEVRGTPRFVFLEAGAAVGYYRSLNRSKTAMNLVYAVKIDQGGERLARVKVNDDVKGLSPTALFERCGDHYISQINRGGMLTITVTLDFLDELTRNKWESKLKLKGSWADVSKDLAEKVEDGGFESSLSVKVVQVGGTPSQALLAAKSCLLSTVEEFNACKQRVDDLMAYASNAFPQQVDSNPAVLHYITAPLQGLGIRDLPSVSQEILDIRRDLEQLNIEATRLADMAAKAREVGLDLEPALATSISRNRDRVKEAAKACFYYRLSGDKLDWSSCLQLGKDLASKLDKVEAARATVHELSVAASSEWGQSILNSYGTPMDVAYAIGKSKKWKLDSSIEVDASGLNAQGRGVKAGDSLSPDNHRGALLRGVENRYEIAEPRGRLTIHAGEAAPFVINDSLGKYADNVGSQTVYWRCTNCSDKQPARLTHRLRVQANQENGSVFHNRAGMSAEYRIIAYGSWRSAYFGTASGPAGTAKDCGESCAAPDGKLQALVMKDANGDGVVVGSEKTLKITANQPVSFLMNDHGGSYRDNTGVVEVILQCVRCELDSRPIDVDAEEAD